MNDIPKRRLPKPSDIKEVVKALERVDQEQAEAVSTTELDSEIGIQIVSYRQKCDMAWSDKVDGAITQEEYEKSIEWSLNHATKAIKKLISKEVVKELESIWSATQPDIVPEGWVPETLEANLIQERIRKLRGGI